MIYKTFKLIFECLREMNKRFSVEEARDILEKSEKLEQIFGEHFTAIVEGDAFEDIYEKCKEAIAEQAGPIIWVPQKEPI